METETSRDFCYVANAVQANLLAATARQVGRRVQCGGRRTSLNQLHRQLRKLIGSNRAPKQNPFELATYGIRWLTLAPLPEI